LFENIDPIYIIDYLFQEGVVNDNDFKLIIYGQNLKDRLTIMSHALANCSAKSVFIFLESLKEGYDFIYEVIFLDKIKNLLRRWQNDESQLTMVAPFEAVESIIPRGVQTTSKPSLRKWLKPFDYLANLLNDGESKQFLKNCKLVQLKHREDPQKMCILKYLLTHHYLLESNTDAAEKQIKKALKYAHRTTEPNYFILFIHNALTRMFLIARNSAAFKKAKSDAMMIIASDVVKYSGQVAGWMFINEVRDLSLQMAMMKKKDIVNYNKIHCIAISRIHLALDHFQNEETDEGILGTGFTICQAVILLMKCGEDGSNMGVFQASSKDIKFAENLLSLLEDSQIPIPESFAVHKDIARSDYYFRKNNTQRALEYAKAARRGASALNMKDYIDAAFNRVTYLKMLDHHFLNC